MYSIKVPATTANMGPGFDSIGMAFQMYNHTYIEEIEKGLEIEIKKNQDFLIPTDEKNLIYKTIKTFFQECGKSVPGIKIIQNDEIPLTRGLGSSAACIVAGLMAANELSGSKLSKKELAEIAAKLEGHPDNSTPAILGGMVVGAMDNEKLNYIKLNISEELKFNVMIPQFPLSTEKARNVIPKKIDLKDAVFNLSRTALLVAAITYNDFDKLSAAMDDRLHQPYRMPIIPDMEIIFKKAKEYGSKAVFLSGAGPTIIAITHKNDSFENKMKEFLESLNNKWDFKDLKPDLNGAEISII